jgi:hypothetical protein
VLKKSDQTESIGHTPRWGTRYEYQASESTNG